jgi:hypothetical protein
MTGPGQAAQEALAAAARCTAASRHHARAAHLLMTDGWREAALDQLQAAFRMGGGEAADCEALGFVASGLGEHELSNAFYARMVEQAPRDATAWYNLATSLRNLGRLGEAEEACDRCLALDAGFAQAALLRAHLRVQSQDRNHIDALARALEASAGDPGDLIFLHYAIGKELDDLGDYDRAFGHFAHGAALRRAALQYDVRQDLAKLDRVGQVYSAATLKAAPTEAAGPYAFIVGLPRSGTTLVERVLTGAASVRSNGETDNFMAALMEHASPTGEDIFDRAARADHPAVGAAYARRAGVPDKGGRVLEKLPLNFLYAGAIRLALPSARIVLLRRSPTDNCFAMFSTLFGSGYPFSYDLAELAAYYRGFETLMVLWRARLGKCWLEVSYEAMTAEPLREGARLARHLGIDWREAMARIEHNRAASATASAAQVRQPIYRSSVGRWRNYERHLAPLVDALAASGIDPDG